MQYENNLEKLKAAKPEGATIVAVKGERIAYFKEAEQKGRLLTFNRIMWVKTWFTPDHLNLKYFDFIAVL